MKMTRLWCILPLLATGILLPLQAVQAFSFCFGGGAGSKVSSGFFSGNRNAYAPYYFRGYYNPYADLPSFPPGYQPPSPYPALPGSGTKNQSATEKQKETGASSE